MIDITFLKKNLPHFFMFIEFKIDVKLDILILLNMTHHQNLVLAPSAIFRGNTVFVDVILNLALYFGQRRCNSVVHEENNNC